MNNRGLLLRAGLLLSDLNGGKRERLRSETLMRDPEEEVLPTAIKLGNACARAQECPTET